MCICAPLSRHVCLYHVCCLLCSDCVYTLEFRMCVWSCQFVGPQLSFTFISIAVAWLTQNNCDLKIASYLRIPVIWWCHDNPDWLVDRKVPQPLLATILICNIKGHRKGYISNNFTYNDIIRGTLQLYITLIEAAKYGQDSGKRIRDRKRDSSQRYIYWTVFGLSSEPVILWQWHLY